jgi:7-carboxy-7-deazaguanine synthase
MSINQVVTWLDDFPETLVEITGGEPLLQKNVYLLMNHLLNFDRTILLETGGSLSITEVPIAVNVILDIKCPGSGMVEKNFWNNLDLLRNRRNQGSRDEIKFVLTSEQDFHWARSIIKKYHLTKRVPVLFSPVTPTLPPDKIAALILREQLPVRMQLQLHKHIWPDIHRGV